MSRKPNSPKEQCGGVHLPVPSTRLACRVNVEPNEKHLSRPLRLRRPFGSLVAGMRIKQLKFDRSTRGRRSRSFPFPHNAASNCSAQIRPSQTKPSVRSAMRCMPSRVSRCSVTVSGSRLAGVIMR